MDDIKAKQEIIEKITASTNILVTVSNNPSVDALSSAIGLTLMLDKMQKHATAVFSGAVPSAIAFLEPEKVLDDTTDSLRDFIIALDKEKADHLRYKVEGDSVKIFITPYKTTITSDDLQFSQGDYNVELVIALGVDDATHLDGALESHGQILHDATIITVTAGEQTSTLGGIDWHDDSASSLSEMLAGLAEALKPDKKTPLLDAPSATALLTGIVAQTERFSNQHTSAKVMTVAAQLIAAGADQQLIATKLQEPYDGTADAMSSETPQPEKKETAEEPQQQDAQGSLNIKQEREEPAAEPEAPIAVDLPKPSSDKEIDHSANATAAGVYALQDDPADAKPVVVEPTLGGTLSATSEQAADDARRLENEDQNKTILSHSYLPSNSGTPPLNANESHANNSFVLGGPTGLDDTTEQPAPTPPAPAPSPSPADLGLPMPPPLPDVSAPPATPAGPYAPEPSPQPERLGDILSDPTPPPPAPTDTPPAVVEPPQPPQPTEPQITDPAQFKIPGQP